MNFQWPDADVFFLSPHLDDVVLACGGLIAQEVEKGRRVAVVTFFAGSPQGELPSSPMITHAHRLARVSAEDDFVAMRRDEDCAALSALGADIIPIHCEFIDSVYRKTPDGEAMYPSWPALFGAPLDSDPTGAKLAALPPLPAGATVYGPIASGHVDHKIVRKFFDSVRTSDTDAWFYEDFGSAMGDPPDGATSRVVELSDDDVQRKIDAISCYKSQIAILFRSESRMKKQIQAPPAGGERYWKLPPI